MTAAFNIPIETIEDADALAIRNELIVPAMIDDACHHMPHIKTVILSHGSPFAYRWAMYKINGLTIDTFLLKMGLALGILNPLSQVKPMGRA
jgi:hypothetical protein